MNQILSRCAKWVLSGLVIYAVHLFCEKKTEGFSILRMKSHLPAAADGSFELDPSVMPCVRSILSQKFYYLGSGGQSFVFSSEDNQYVLKFFRNHTLLPHIWLKKLPWPLSFKQNHFKKIDRCEAKLIKSFDGYIIAMKELRNESGLTFLHLQKTDCLKQQITISDPLHITHVIDADDFEFCIQKKTVPFKEYFKDLAQKNQVSKMQDTLLSVFQLLQFRFQKGIVDEDNHVYDNIGMLNGSPIFIDAGRFKRKHQTTYAKRDSSELCIVNNEEAVAYVARFQKWIENEYPQVATYFQEIILKTFPHD